MTIVFYNVSDEPIKLSKTLSGGTTLTGTLRAPASVTDLVIVIENNSFPTWNYAYISEFGRYYFIQNITSVREDLWQIDMHVDVLMSNKTMIQSTYAFVARNQNTHNDELSDPMIKSSSEVMFEECTFPTSSELDQWIPYNNAQYDTDHGKQRLLLMIKAKNLTFYKTAPQTTETIIPNFGSFIMTTTYEGFRDFISALRTNIGSWDENWLTEIIMDVWYVPYKVALYPTNGYIQDIHIMWGTREVTLNLPASTYFLTSGVYGEQKRTSWEFVVPHHYSKAYQNDSPITQYKMKFEPFGMLPIDSSVLIGSSQQWIIVDSDPLSGSSNVYLEVSDGVALHPHKKIKLGSGNVAQHFNLAYVGAPENKVILESIVNVLSGGIKGATSGLKAGLAGVASGALGGVLASGYGDVLNSFQNHTEQVGGVSGSSLCDAYPTIYQIYPVALYEVEGSLYGYPLYAYASLGTLTGFTTVSEVHLDGFSTSTESELREIESLLKSGVILPST